jgi:hypothetical protein
VDYKGTVSLAHLLMIVAYMLACMYKLHILVNVVKIVEVSVILHVIGHWKDPLRSERIIYVSTIKASVIPQRNTLAPGGKVWVSLPKLSDFQSKWINLWNSACLQVDWYSIEPIKPWFIKAIKWQRLTKLFTENF